MNPSNEDGMVLEEKGVIITEEKEEAAVQKTTEEEVQVDNSGEQDKMDEEKDEQN